MTEVKSTNAVRVAEMLETIERMGDAHVKLSPDARRLLVQATILARREADADLLTACKDADRLMDTMANTQASKVLCAAVARAEGR